MKTKARGFYIGLMFEEAAAVHGNSPVVLDQPLQLAPAEGTTVTVGRLAALVRRLSAQLHAAGIRPQDRVVIFKTNNFDIALLAAAAQWIGAVPALLSPMLPGDTVSQLLRRLEQPWLITDRAMLDRETIDLDAARTVLLSAGEALLGTQVLPDVDGLPEPVAAVPAIHQPAFISHTSGTTGLPKLAIQTPSALWYRLRVQKLVASRTWRKETVALCISFVHARFYSALYMGISYGNPLVVAIDPSPAAIGGLFREHRPGVVETQPNTFVSWEELAGAPGAPLSSVRYYSATFDAIHPRTVQTLLGASKRPRPKFFQLYGQTETGPVTGNWISQRKAASVDGRCVGWALPGTIRLRIVDDDGTPLLRGEVGHIEVRSRTRATDYLGESDRFAAQLHDGWWRMGDTGTKDRIGRVHLLDREIDRLEDTDSNLEIEDELMSLLPELREIVIVAGDHGQPVPVVCTRGDLPLDNARWKKAIAGRPGLGAPRQLRFDQLPMTATWKIRRPELVQLLQGGGLDD